MLSVSVVNNAAGASAYYGAADHADGPDEQASAWYGLGAQALGLDGPVDPERFTAILAGQLPDGTDLRRRVQGVNTHRPGYDLTFSAPKSISVLALVMGDRRLMAAFKQSVRETLDEIEKLATTRTMNAGIASMERTGNLVMAMFCHETSRNLEPQLHIHVVTANVTLSATGWKALSSDPVHQQGFTDTVWRQQVSLGGLQRLRLRQIVEELGYPVEITSDKGTWECAGVPTGVFSSRRQDIVDAVGEHASAREKSQAALATRRTKPFTDRASLRERWQAVLAGTNFDYDAFMKTVEAHRVKQAAHRPSDPATLSSDRRIDKPVGEPGREPVLQRDPPAPLPLQEAVREAIERLSTRQVRVTYDDVMTSILNHVCLSPETYAQARAALDHAIRRGQLLAVNTAQTLFTTAAHVRDEARLMQVASRLAGRAGGWQVWSGDAGVMAQVAQADRAVSLIDVRGNAAFVNALHQTILRMAERHQRPLVVATVAGPDGQSPPWADCLAITRMTAERLKDATLPANALILVSESERLTPPALHDVLKAVLQQGATALVVDTHAHRAVGMASAVLRGAGVQQFTASPATEQVSVTLVPGCRGDQRLAAAARHYARERAQGKTVTLMAGNPRVRDQLTTCTRDTLTAEGQLGTVLGALTVRVPVWLDASTRHDRSRYRVGMILEHHDGNGRMAAFTLAGVSERYHLLTLMDEKGQLQGMSVRAVDSHWRLFREKTLEIRQGERLCALGSRGPDTGRTDTLTVTGFEAGSRAGKGRWVMDNGQGKTTTVPENTPLYADYGYVRSFASRRSSTGSVIAVLAGKDVTDATVNLLRRSAETVMAFTPLDEAAIHQRLTENRPTVTVSQEIQALTGERSLTAALRCLDSKKRSPAERAVRLAIEKATGTGVTFSGIAVLASAIATDRHMTPERTGQALQRLAARGEIIPLAAGQGAPGESILRENVDHEVTILRAITDGKNSVAPLLAPGLSGHSTRDLTPGQRQAAQMILTSTDRITLIQGYAGVGKTTQFRTVMAAFQAMAHPPAVLGLAPTHRAVSELTGAGIPAQTIASFISENGEWQAAGQSRDFSHTLIIVDESSMNGNAQLATLLTIVTTGGGRVVLCGDRDQLKSMESGAPFALALDRSVADTAIMRDIVRQTPALKPAVEALIAGNVRGALRVVRATAPAVVPRQANAFSPASSTVDGRSLATDRGRAMDDGGPSLHRLIADDYTGRTPAARDSTLIVAELNADRIAINAAIHHRLTACGTLPEGVTVPILVRVNNSHADLGSQTFWQHQCGHTARVGEHYFQIGQTDASSGIVRLRGLSGVADRWFSPAELRKERVAVFEPALREFSTGEKIRLTATDRERDHRASETGTIVHLTKEGKLQLDNAGRLLTLDPATRHADRHIDYGYAITTYSAQGASVPYVIALTGTKGGRKRMASLDSTYVALSRAREHIQIYADDMACWLSQVERQRGRRETVHDVMLRGEDQRAGRERRVWEKSRPLAETALFDSVSQRLMNEARFMPGETPELLWPVMNAYGRQRGNWHVPVSPATGNVNFTGAHYEGAADGTRILLQRGHPHEQALQARDRQHALMLMTQYPHRPITMPVQDRQHHDEPQTEAAKEAWCEKQYREDVKAAQVPLTTDGMARVRDPEVDIVQGLLPDDPELPRVTDVGLTGDRHPTVDWRRDDAVTERDNTPDRRRDVPHALPYDDPPDHQPALPPPLHKTLE